MQVNDPWQPGLRVETPAVNGVVVTTTTTARPFRWGALVLVSLADLPGLWECRLLRRPARDPAPALDASRADDATSPA